MCNGHLVARACQAVTVLTCLYQSALASPNHDEIQARTQRHTASQHYSSKDQRRLVDVGSSTCQEISAMSWNPLRVTYEIVDTSVSAAKVTFVSDVLMKRAADYFMKALTVRQASAPLRANRFCSLYNGKWDFETTWSCKAGSATNPSCGTDGFQIPDKYLNKQRTCNANRCISNSGTCSGDCAGFTAADQGAGNPSICESCSEEPEGAGVVDSDFHIFVLLRDTAGCDGDTQAYASSCVQDQCDRPIFGVINFCLSKISLEEADTDKQVATAIHEAMHALGFSSDLFKYFRNADGTPKFPRDTTDPTKFQGQIRWTCSGSSYTWNDPQGSRVHADLATANIVQTFGERGMDSCPCPIGKNTMEQGCIVAQSGLRNPSCVMKMVTPNVLAKAREHFDCSTLNGMELENQATSACTIFGSHWEQRIFMTDVMAPVQTNAGPVVISAVTLALFEDSGWYKPDYSMADTLVKGLNWGYGQGCDFALNKCVSGGSTSFPRHWCTAENTDICSIDRVGTQSCKMDTYTSSLPSQITFFSTPTVGKMAEPDYCPFYNTGITNRVCTSTASITKPYGNVNFRREVMGSSSRCLESNLNSDVPAAGGGTFPAEPADFASVLPACYQISCNAQNNAYDIMMSNLDGGVVSLGTCTQAGQVLTTTGLNGQVNCVAPAEFCGVMPWKMSTAAMTASPAPPPATCDSFSCTGATPVNKGSGVQCSGDAASCTAAACCEAKATCDQFTSCTGGTPVNMGIATQCSGNLASCDASTCCEAKATCNSFSCTGATPNNKGQGVLCSGAASSCDASTCCEAQTFATCDSFSCTGATPVNMGSGVKCSGEDTASCIASTCCEAKATCDKFTSCTGATPLNVGSGTQCSGNADSCDASTCCEAKAKCGSTQCSADTVSMPDALCSGNADTCNAATCCEAKATCGSFSCTGATPNNKGSGVLCSGTASSCDVSTCCQACTDFGTSSPCETAGCSWDGTCKAKATCDSFSCTGAVNKGNGVQCSGSDAATCDAATCCEPACAVPTTAGYDFNDAGGTLTLNGFSPTGVMCASGYKGSVSYTVCGSGGDAYAVSGCDAYGCQSPCKECVSQSLRKSSTSCASCSAGSYLVSTTCQNYGCGSACKTCLEQAARVNNQSCATCNDGDYLPLGTGATCQAKATCAGFSCTGATPVSKGSAVKCSGNATSCNVNTCCEAAATCNQFVCTGATPANKGLGTPCSGDKSSCNVKTCCEAEFKGTISIKAPGVEKSKVEAALKTSLANKFGVSESQVIIKITETRRLQSSTARRLEGNFQVEFTITAPPEKATAIQSTVEALKTDQSTLLAEAKKELKAAGVSDAVLTAVKVESFAAQQTTGDVAGGSGSIDASSAKGVTSVLMFTAWLCLQSLSATM